MKNKWYVSLHRLHQRQDRSVFCFFQTRGNLTSLLWLLRLFQNIYYFLHACFQCIYFKQQVIGAYNNMRQFSQSLWSAGSDKKTQARLCKSITSHIPLRHYFGYGPFKRPRVKPSILKGEPGPVRVVGRPFNSPLDIYWQYDEEQEVGNFRIPNRGSSDILNNRGEEQRLRAS